MRNIFLVTALLNFFQAAYAYENVKFNEIEPSPVHRQLMEQDQAGKFFALAPDGALWFLGIKALWRWYPLTGSVSKLTAKGALPSMHRSQKTIFHARTFFLISAARVWGVNAETGDVIAMSGKWGDQCKDSIFSISNRQLYVFNSCGVYNVDSKAGRLSEIKIDRELLGFDFVLGSRDKDQFYAIKDKDIYELNILKSTIGTKKIYSAKSKLKGLSFSDGMLLTWTHKLMMAFDAKSMARIATIPNVGAKSIQSFINSSDLHVVLFSGGIMELMSLSSKKQYSTRLEDFSFGHALIDPAGAFLVLEAGSFPRILDLQGQILQ